MAWHVLASSPVDFDKFERESSADRMPGHLLPVIARNLGAKLSKPDPTQVKPIDRILARIYALPHHWELARRIYPKLADGDAVFTTGCDSGIPLAVRCVVGRKDVAFAIGFSDPGRPRPRVLGWILVIMLRRLLILVTIDEQADNVRRSFGRRAAGVFVIAGQTDCRFFRPADRRPEVSTNGDGLDPQTGRRVVPLIAGCGAEQRDYRTLAEALETTDAVARICFASPNLSDKTRFTMPDPVPSSMDFRHLEFAQLRELYQQADLVVIPLLENRYSAGLTTLFEAVACQTPVVVTRSPGVIQDFIDEDLVGHAAPGEVEELRAAINAQLADPASARARAVRARQYLVDRYSSDKFLERLEDALSQMVASGYPSSSASTSTAPG